MKPALRQTIEGRLEAEGSSDKSWAGAVLAAFEGRDALDDFLSGGAVTARPAVKEPNKRPAEAYLTSLSVEGFRGIGPAQTLSLNPAPGLTLIVGRNGSGKSSFAEGLEVLFTGDSKRWADRSRVWKDGWRNLHRPNATSITAELLLAGTGAVTVRAEWNTQDALDEPRTTVQPKTKPKTSLQQLGWTDALVSYRPFLSYNELGSMLDEGPSKLYDALSLVLGLEEIVSAQNVLSKSRTERQRIAKSAEEARAVLMEQLKQLLDHASDDRANASLAALRSAGWGLDRLEDLASGTTVARDDGVVSVLAQAAAVEAPSAEEAARQIAALHETAARLKAIAGTDAERSRKSARLLEGALELYLSHAVTDCPVCGTTDVIGPDWQETTREEIERLRADAAESEEAHRQAATVREQAFNILRAAPSRLFEQLTVINVEGAQNARDAWALWAEGRRLEDPAELAAHIEAHHAAFLSATEKLRQNAASELQRRQDRWKPVAAAIASWIPLARKALRGEEELEFISDAEKWLKNAAAAIRDERFAPIADRAMEIWRLLRLNSNVELGRIQLAGAGPQRRVTLDVTVDGVNGAALGVMSQGELHSLALSLFLPRATLPESPFRFVVIDDPVQSMDPARVDGLARALNEIARTRQVIVFTHDTRLPEAVRRLGIHATMLEVTRRPQSVVEVRTALDPIRAHIEDALALAYTSDLPRDVLHRVVPGFCRSALEAAFMQAVRRRRLASGHTHEDVETELQKAQKLTTLAALALFDDKDRGGDVMRRLNQFGSWAGAAFKDCKDGAHGGVTTDFRTLIENTEDLCRRVLELK
jgi:recombinational DNA repair ATPase RecF